MSYLPTCKARSSVNAAGLSLTGSSFWRRGVLGSGAMYLKPCLIASILFATPAVAQVSVQEYTVPRGHGIHDVWADPAPNGPVWISAQGSGHLGILDPKTGRIEFVALGSGSSPHGVVAAQDGSPLLTDGGQNAIVRVDAKTRAVKVWKLPEDSGYT